MKKLLLTGAALATLWIMPAKANETWYSVLVPKGNCPSLESISDNPMTAPHTPEAILAMLSRQGADVTPRRAWSPESSSVVWFGFDVTYRGDHKGFLMVDNLPACRSLTDLLMNTNTFTDADETAPKDPKAVANEIRDRVNAFACPPGKYCRPVEKISDLTEP